MRGEHNEFKVGLTVTIVLVLFILVLAFIGKWDTLFRSTTPIQVRFHHTEGIESLRVKDPVRVGGVNVGRVQKIWLQTDKVARKGKLQEELFVHVLAEVPSDVRVHADARIGIGTKFVGEGGTLDILDTGRAGKPLKKGQVVDGEAPAGINELAEQMSRQLDENDPNSLLSQIKSQLDVKNPASLLAKIHKSIDDINSTTGSLRHEMTREQAAAALAKIHVVLDNLNASLAGARKMIEEAAPKITAAAAHVQNTARRIDEDMSVKLARELDKSDNGTLLAKLHVSLTSAQAGMDNLRVMTQTGKEILVVNRDNLQSIVDNFAETAAHLKATAKEVRRNPWRLLYTPTKPEAEYANLMESARAFSEAAGSLDSANTKLKQLIALNPQSLDPNDPTLGKIRDEIKKAFCDFEQAQKKLWEILKLKS